MLSYREALHEILPRAHSFGKELVALDDSLGRILSENIMADRDYPPFNRSAMDGIAISYADFENGIREFAVAETIYAGSGNRFSIASGECYKIMTGAAVPGSASAVIRNEDCMFEENRVRVKTVTCKPYQHIAQQGQDLSRGSVALKGPLYITPAIIGLLAALGKAMIWVEKMPSVSLFTTGNEVVDVEQEASRLQIRNSNSHLMKALLNQTGIAATSCEHVKDEKNALEAAFSNRLSSDILVVSGGVSAGDEDFVPEVFGQLGFKKLFHKVAIKPGKPVWCGEINGGPIVFALPGNPFACMVTFKLFVEVFINYAFGLGLPAADHLPLNAGHLKKTRFDEFFPVTFSPGFREVKASVSNGSGDVRLGMSAEAFALHAAEEENLADGTLVSVYVV